MKNEIILYKSQDIQSQIEVRIDDDTVWLNRHQISSLFGRDIKTIGKHINNLFKDAELEKKVVVAKFATTTPHGAIEGKFQTRLVEYYNLDVIISVGYRVKSKEGTLFRIWATNVLREYMLKGYALNKRMNRIENSVVDLAEKVKQIDFQIKSNQLPEKGLFFDGQVFDAYSFIIDIFKKANKEIILIDNYVDKTVLIMLNNRKQNVKATIYAHKISKELRLDIEKHNAQYPSIVIKELKKAHDRFIVIDGKDLYHFGASLKDAGKKWFAFSKMEGIADLILERLLDE